jgi:hypothetical protein
MLNGTCGGLERDVLTSLSRSAAPKIDSGSTRREIFYDTVERALVRTTDRTYPVAATEIAARWGAMLQMKKIEIASARISRKIATARD